MNEQLRMILGLVSSLGFVSILIVIIGRLWTTTYFSFFGLSTSDLEFSVYDFAFRSLEAEIGLIFGAIGFGSAWLSRSWLERRGLLWAAGELAIIGLLLFLLLVLVADVPGWDASPNQLLSTTGVLGTAGGLVLMAMLWFVVDIWQGPGTSAGQWPRFLMTGDVWRGIAIVLGAAILFAYLPFISEKLATAEARADLASGKFPIAILESDGDLPGGIATDADPRKSVTVRVILNQSQTTYVLHSTQCTVIGDLEVEKSEEGEIVARSSDFCRVFAIPTSRLKFIEYVQVSGSPPSNDTRFLAEEVGLSEPFNVTVSTRGASGDDDIFCGSDTDEVFERTVWYRFAPPTDGTVLATVTSDADLEPAVGIWAESDESVLEEDPALGSGANGFACEDRFKGLEQVQRVGTVANVQKDTRYLIAIGTLNDKGGALNISLEFTPQATFLFPGFPDDVLPQVSLPSVLGQVQMELRSLDETTYEMEAYQDDLGEFSLKSGENEVMLELTTAQVDATRVLLETTNPVDLGIWTLQIPEGFKGEVRLTTTALPDLVLAFNAAPSIPDDARVQRALVLLIDLKDIRDSLSLGRVSFDPESVDLDAFMLEEGADAVAIARELLAEATDAGGLAVQIQVEPQGDQEEALLRQAADILQRQLSVDGLEVTIDACQDQELCIRVFFLGSEES